METSLRRSIVAVLVLVGGCVAPRQAPPPAPVVAPPPPPMPAPAPPPVDWRDRAYTEGDWSYVAGEARFGPLIWRCRSAQVAITWAGADATAVTIRTSTGDRVLPAQPGTEGATMVLGARDPLLDQIVFSRGRFMMEAGAQQLILPTWPEMQRVVEDCRG